MFISTNPHLLLDIVNRLNTDQIITIVIVSILEKNLEIIITYNPTFQSLFRLFPQLLQSFQSKSSSKPRPTINFHYNNIDKPSSRNYFLGVRYDKQDLSYLRQVEPVNSLDLQDQYPLYFLTMLSTSHY